MKASESLTLIQPPEAVWAFITDIDNWAKWFGEQLEARMTSAGSLRLGSTVSAKFHPMGRVYHVHVEVTEFAPVQRMTVQFSLGPVFWRESFGLEPSNSGTRFTHTIDIRFRNRVLHAFSSVLNPFSGLLMGKQIRAELEGLERALQAKEKGVTH
jgi:uncharacterized protein YndB with AHSA1/START domain